MKRDHYANRRTVLKTIGAGVAAGAVLTGSASAKGNHYGNGNAIGAFLNEEAMFKESPVWDTGVADMTGEEEVNVLFGGLTSIDLPFPDAPDMGPWGVDPRAVKVSPGTKVTWTWWENGLDAHHLVSYFDPPYADPFPKPHLDHEEEDDHEHDHKHDHEHPGGEDEFFVHKNAGGTFTYTFEEVGTYLYFCYPHGTPFTFEFPELGEIENLFGHRGAVKVVDD